MVAADQIHGAGDSVQGYVLGQDFRQPLMQICYNALNELKVPSDRIRYEFFGPLEDLQAANDGDRAA